MTQQPTLAFSELLRQLRNPFFGEDLAQRDAPVLVVDLDELTLRLTDADAELLALHMTALRAVTIGILRGEVDKRLESPLSTFDILLAPEDAAGLALVPSTSVEDDLGLLHAAVQANPQASVALAQLLRLGVQHDVGLGLVAESLTYSTLQAGPEFARWRRQNPARDIPPDTDPILVTNSTGTMEITLNRPQRANAFSAAMRDALVETLRAAYADPSIGGVLLRGAGASFCSGGDLDEFGTTPSPGDGHNIRLQRSAGWWLHLLGGRVRTELHGACIGAGIELPLFGGAVLAHPDTVIRLPEVAMGLVPGAGGTVSMTRRIGRHRTAYLGITGRPIEAHMARRWGVVDRVIGG